MEKFCDIEGLEFDRMRNIVRILRKEFKTEVQYISCLLNYMLNTGQRNTLQVGLWAKNLTYIFMRSNNILCSQLKDHHCYGYQMFS